MSKFFHKYGKDYKDEEQYNREKQMHIDRYTKAKQDFDYHKQRYEQNTGWAKNYSLGGMKRAEGDMKLAKRVLAQNFNSNTDGSELTQFVSVGPEGDKHVIPLEYMR